MYNKEHGMDLARLLAGSDTQINSQQTLLNGKEVGGHTIKWTVLSYDNGANVGIFYLEWEIPAKKGMSPMRHQNLAAVRLESNDENAAQQTIDDLMGTSTIGIPHLRTSKYLIADGTRTVELYERLVREPPMTGKDLANALMQYMSREVYPNQGWSSKIPDPRMRIRLGM